MVRILVQLRFLMLLVCGLMASYVYLSAQATIIRGVINSDIDLAQEYVTIDLLDSSFHLIQEIELKDKNYFETEINTIYSTINAVVTRLGCDTYVKRIKVNQGGTSFLSIQLDNCVQLLNEVVVSSQRSFVSEKGDTLVFDVDGFRVETDLTLGDILQRIPSIEINDENQILYQGKRIRQIWVEGRDILNNQHNLALEGLRAADIKHIEIVHEYKPFHKRFTQDFTDEVAMNIGLKDEAKGRINGDMEVLGGSNRKYLLDAELIQVKEQSGSSNFIRSNNIGNAIIQPLEYLGLLNDFSELKSDASGEIDIVPDILMPNGAAVLENQHFISRVSDFDVDEKTRFKLTLLGLYKTTEKDATVRTEFFDETPAFTGQLDTENSFPMLNVGLNLKRQANPNVLLSADLPVIFHHQNKRQGRIGQYDSLDYATNFINNGDFLNISPKFSLNVQHAHGWVSAHDIGIEFRNNSSEAQFYQDSLTEPLYQQSFDNQYRHIKVVSSIEKKSGIFLWKAWNQIMFGNFSNAISDDVSFFENSAYQAYRWQNWSPRLQYGLQNEHWMAHVQMEYIWDGLIIGNNSFTEHRFNPLMRIKYSWHRTQFVGITIKSRTNYIDQQNAFDLYLLEDNLLVNRFALQEGVSAQKKSLDAYYFYANIDEKMSLRLNVNYNIERNALSSYNYFENGFVVSEVFLAPTITAHRAEFAYSFPIFAKRYQFDTKLSGQQVKTERTPHPSIQSTQFRTECQLATKWPGYFNGQIGSGLYFYNQKIDDISRPWHRWQTNINLRYIVADWKAEIQYQWDYSIINNSRLHLHHLNWDLQYRLKDHWSLYLRGQDVFNLSGSQINQLTSTLAYVEEETFQRITGSILLGMKYSF